MQTTFRFYSDPGHGWAKVSKALLTELGIAERITPYSYMRGDFAYLEEDCDVSTLCNALSARGVSPKFVGRTSDKRSRIRNYDRYVAA